MEDYERIRRRMGECSLIYCAGAMDRAKYVETMNQLNAERKVYEDKMSAPAKSAPVMNLNQIELLRFICTDTIPTTFKKIHARFPHLTFDEVVAFEQTVRSAGGSIMTHSGMFVPTYRSWHYEEQCMLARKSVVVSWGCCYSRGHDGKNIFADKCESYEKTNQYGAYDCRSGYLYADYSNHQSLSPDLMNRSPVGTCSNPSIFSLTDEMPGQNEDDTIAEIKSAAQTQINKIEAEISALHRKAGYLDGLLKTLSDQ